MAEAEALHSLQAVEASGGRGVALPLSVGVSLDGSESTAVGMSSAEVRRWPRFRCVAKRSFDVIFGAFALVLLSPIFLVITVSVLLCEGRPVLYRQTRVGRGGRAFTMYKFRSMVTDADERRDEVRAENQRAGSLFKTQADPRCTRVGRFLRATSLDELPQLYNVVSGSMSLVGPRPTMFEERDRFPTELLEREVVRPGVTGLWQVKRRRSRSAFNVQLPNDPDFDQYKQLDLLYVRAYTFWGDLGILLRTPVVVVRDAWRDLARTEPVVEPRGGALGHASAGYAEGLRQSRADLRASRHNERRAAMRGAFVVGAGLMGAAVVAAAAFTILVFAGVFTVSSGVGGGHRAATLVQQPPSATTPPSSPSDGLDPSSPSDTIDPSSQRDTTGALSSSAAAQTGRSPLSSSNRVATPPTMAGAQVSQVPTPSNSSGSEQLSLASSPPPSDAPAPAPTTAPAGSPTCPGDAEKSPNGQVGRCSSS
jgi:lipopolysaccharide/colanic/teichoic acid biosynthesis glycosyltransferase